MQIFLGQIKFRINSDKIQIMILTFFLQYFKCFGEVIFSPLVYFKMKYFSGGKIIKTKILVLLFDENQIRKFEKIPNSLRGSLSCLGFIEDLSKCNKAWYANDDLCITFQIENLGCYNKYECRTQRGAEGNDKWFSARYFLQALKL